MRREGMDTLFWESPEDAGHAGAFRANSGEYDSFTSASWRLAWRWSCASVLVAGVIGTCMFLDSAARTESRELAALTKPTEHERAAAVSAVAFAPDGHCVAAGGSDGPVRLWNVKALSEHAVLRGHACVPKALVFAPNGKVVVSAGGDWSKHVGEAFVWNLKSASLEKVLVDRQGPVVAAAFSLSGRWLAASHGTHQLTIWDAVDWEIRATFTGERQTTALAFTADEKGLLAADEDGRVRVWDLDARKVDSVHDCHPGCICSMVFAADGRSLASVGADATVHIWDAATGRPRQVLRVDCGLLPIRAMAFSPDGRHLALAGGLRQQAALVHLWNLCEGKETAILAGHARPILTVSFAPDGRRLASAGCDETVRIWNLDMFAQEAVLYRANASFEAVTTDNIAAVRGQ